ncbi:class I SAM-dependent methyltransferase [Chloroflexota bacterium]
MTKYIEEHGKSARLPARRFGYYLRLRLIREALRALGTTRITLLDIGSAHGDFAGDLVQEEGRVTCLDINLERLREGKKRYSKIAFVGGDGQELPFRSYHFDVVMILNTLRYTPSPLKVLLESDRVLKDGGGLVLICHNRLSPDTLLVRNPEIVRLLSMRNLKQMLAQSNFQIMQAKYIFITHRSTHRRFLGIIPKLEAGLDRLGLNRIFPEIFIYAVKKETKE